MDEVLGFLNKRIREEHGNRVTLGSLWSDADVDSFGTVVVFLDMDEKYGCFPNEWFSGENAINWNTLTIQEIVERVMNESTKL